MARNTSAKGGRSRKTGVRPPEPFEVAWAYVRQHPLFMPLAPWRAPARARDTSQVHDDGWAQVSRTGAILVHPTRTGTVPEWTWVFAHLLLHLGYGHANASARPSWAAPEAAAADVSVNRLLEAMKLGQPPAALAGARGRDLPTQPEEALAQRWRTSGVPSPWDRCGTNGAGSCCNAATGWGARSSRDWEQALAQGLSAAVSAAIDVAGGARASLTDTTGPVKPWELARRWFISSYPLLGSAIASLKVVAEADLARAWQIDVAAINPVVGELYINPMAVHTDEEWRFILAHECLHAALGHHARCGSRDPLLWNLATDYRINGWLLEMGVGQMPDGLLHDAQFNGMSAEEIYDRIAAAARRYRKLATLRGVGRGDMIGETDVDSVGAGATDLDTLVRSALLNGLEVHQGGRRGLIPAGLVQEIRALAHPPVRWDAQLARWFEEHFPAEESLRSYARPSRRQASSPDIPRPGRYRPLEEVTRRTFGVVIDTSASMGTVLLGKGLGAIASYAAVHDVPAVRVVFCDAAPYDAGYLPVEQVAGRVKVRGRGGTELQPALDLLERAEDFPPDAPVLIVTDGWIDTVRVRREHAYLLPEANGLPFKPKGPVFRVR